MENGNVQVAFFQHLKSQLPTHVSLVEEIADLLNISTDSAYRRLRGEKPISFEELQKLCMKYKISLDQLFHLQSDTLIFSGRNVGQPDFKFHQYLNGVVSNLQYMNTFEKKEIFHLNKDVPIFHFFYFPRLAAFKLYFWRRSIAQDEELLSHKFSFDLIDEELLKVGEKMADAYAQLPCTEIWNIENISASLMQINYYKDSNLFQSTSDIHDVYQDLEKCIDHIEYQAELGYKTSPDGKVHYRHIPYRIYVNEFILGDNTIQVKLNDTLVTYLTHSVFNYLNTRDQQFNESISKHFHNIIRKSTLISDSGEKDRRRFFTAIRTRINERKAAIS